MRDKPYSDRTDLERIASNWNKTIGLFARGEYSLSIVRAAVAAELTLNYAIRQELHYKRNLPLDFVHGLLKWANGIQGKLDRLYLPITADEQYAPEIRNFSASVKRLNEQLNQIAHKSEFRIRETA